MIKLNLNFTNSVKFKNSKTHENDTFEVLALLSTEKSYSYYPLYKLMAYCIDSALPTSSRCEFEIINSKFINSSLIIYFFNWPEN